MREGRGLRGSEGAVSGAVVLSCERVVCINWNVRFGCGGFGVREKEMW